MLIPTTELGIVRRTVASIAEPTIGVRAPALQSAVYQPNAGVTVSIHYLRHVGKTSDRSR